MIEDGSLLMIQEMANNTCIFLLDIMGESKHRRRSGAV